MKKGTSLYMSVPIKMRRYPSTYCTLNLSLPSIIPTAYTVTILKLSIVHLPHAEVAFVRALFISITCSKIIERSHYHNGNEEPELNVLAIQHLISGENYIVLGEKRLVLL